MNKRESQARVEDLFKGPWTARGALARDTFTPRTDFRSLAAADGVVNRKTIRAMLLPADRRRQAEIARILAPHWEAFDPDDVDEEEAELEEGKYVELRESFDFALESLQLLELGIATGYVRAREARRPARTLLLTLLWSPGASRFVEAYDYVGVRFLAARVGIDLGLASVTAPPVRDNGSARFASFLSHHALWVNDPEIDGWLAARGESHFQTACQMGF